MKFPFVHSAAQEPYRILVADEAPIIKSAFQALPPAEVQLHGVVTDRQALINAVANAASLDAVLCADHLAGPFGAVQTLQQLRAAQALPDGTAFVIMSGDPRRSNLMVNIEARPDGILLKPFSPDTLMKKLDSVVQHRRALAPLNELTRRGDWPALMRLATDMLARGTRYHAAVMKFKLEAFAHLNTPETALSSCEAMLAENPNAPELLVSAARLAYQQGAYDEAERTLARILELQPANVFASDLLVVVLQDKGDLVAAQHQLQRSLRQSPNSIERHRLLGHLALLNGDTGGAQRAYLTAMRLHAEAKSLDEVDVVNASRTLMLQGQSHHAWEVITDARKTLPDSLMLEVMERLVEAVTYRQHDAFSKTQQRIKDAVEMRARPMLRDAGALALAAVEASLMSLMVHQAFLLSKELVNTTTDMKLHPAQKQWAQKLHNWSIDVPDHELPKGMYDYHRFMK